MQQISVAQFALALKEIGQPSDGERRFLQAHYYAPRHATTATILAENAGYRNHGGINLCYGKLAERIRAKLGRKRRKTRLSLLVDFVCPPAVTNKHWVLMMRPEFAKALNRAK